MTMKTEMQMRKDKSRLRNLLKEYRDEMITNITQDNDKAHISIDLIDEVIKLVNYALVNRSQN